jgi:GAF domain-containing protein/HAMP domain-containing protein
MNTSASVGEQARRASRIAFIFVVLSGLSLGLAIYTYITSGQTELGWWATVAVGVFFVLTLISFSLARVGITTVSMGLLILSLSALSLSLAVLIADLGVILGIALILEVVAIASLTLPSLAARLTIVVSVVVGGLTILVDVLYKNLGLWERLTLPSFFQLYAPIIVAVGMMIVGGVVIQQFPKFRLNTKLLLGFLFVALVPLSALTVRFEQSARENLENAVKQTLAANAQQTATSLDAFISANLSAISSEARLSVFADYLRTPAGQRAGQPVEQAVLQNIRALQETSRPNLIGRNVMWVIQSYTLLDANRNLAFTNSSFVPVAPELVQSDLFTVPFVNGIPYASPVYYSRNDARMFFAAPVLDVGQSTILGVLVSEISAEWLTQSLIQASRLPGQTEGEFTVALYDEHGLRLGSSESFSEKDPLFIVQPEVGVVARWQANYRVPPGMVAGDVVDLPELNAAVLQALEADSPIFFNGLIHGGETKQEHANEPHLSAITRLQSQPWVIIYAQHESDALASTRDQTQAIVLLALALGLAVAALSVLAARNLTRPINQLTQAAERVSVGDLAARATVTSQDEIGQLTTTFNAMTAQLQQTLSDLEQRVDRRTAQLQATADISRATAGIRNLDELLELAVEMIRGRFGFYHASVFLLDTAEEYAVLRESTGEVGAQLKARAHRLAVGSRSLVGWVTQNRKLRVARDVAGDPFHFKNPLLPETRSELCIPLLVGERLLGALDVQSRNLDAFSESDLQALQVLADQMSVAIENAESFERAQASLSEVRLLYQQTLQTGWREVVRTRAPEMVMDIEPGGATSQDPICIPLRLRNEVIGMLELHGRPAEQPLLPEEQAVLETVAAQLATALESAALLQESQLRSRYDQLVTAITDEMRATLNPAFIMQNGIRQLGRAVGATEVTVKLQPRRGGTAK